MYFIIRRFLVLVLLAVVLNFIFSEAVFAADQWRHIHMLSQNGVAIGVDYKAIENQGSFEVSPLVWINVSGPDLIESDLVRAVFMVFCESRGQYPSTPDQQWEIDLGYAGSKRFTGSLGPVSTAYHQRSAYGRCRQELAVVVSDTWLKTQNGGDNFKFQM